MLCAFPRRLVAFSSVRHRRMIGTTAVLRMADVNTDEQGRRIRSRRSSPRDSDSNDDNTNEWLDVGNSWDAPPANTGGGGGWDDFDPLATPSPRTSRPPRERSSTRDFKPRGDRDFRRSNTSNSNNYSRRGPPSRSNNYNRGPPDADHNQKKINMRALEGSGYVHLYGLAPVRNALRAQRREFKPLENRFLLDEDDESTAETDDRKPEAQFRPYLFLQERKGKVGRAGDKSMQAEEVQRLAEELGLPVAHVDKGILNTLSGNRPHQGCVLRCGKLEFEPLSRIPMETDSPRLWLVLDEVVDPQNLGALLRSAYFFGKVAVLVCAKNSAPPSPTVSASSAGALEDMTVYATNSLPRTLASADQDGFRIIGASASSPPDSDIPVYDLDKLPVNKDANSPPTLLVLGSEGHGIRSLVANTCTEFVKIPGTADQDSVDSLNVSVTGGILLWHLVQNILGVTSK
eukprot:scaffold7101_cov153-Amphora_coffeaeformis.AAC.2